MSKIETVVLNRVTPPWNHGLDDYQPAEEMLKVGLDIVKRHENGEKLYFRFNTGDRKGSIAFLKKIDKKKLFKLEKDIHRRHSFSSEPQVEYRFYFSGIFGWDDRKNTARAELFVQGDQISFLDGYTDESVWEKADKKAEAAAIKENTVVKDMRGTVIKEGDIVIFINSRYGGGSRLDYGIVDEIHVKVDHHSHNGKKTVEVTTIVKNARQERGKDIMSKIKNPEHYLLIVTGTDLEDGALEKRLST